MKNVAVKLSIYDEFYRTKVFDKRLFEVRVKCTDKKRASGVVIPFTDSIVLDENGDDYVLTIIAVDTDKDAIYLSNVVYDSHFLVRLNDEQAKQVNIGFIEHNKDDVYSYFCNFLKSIGLFNKVKDLFDSDYASASMYSFDELAEPEITEIGIFLTKIDKEKKLY